MAMFAIIDATKNLFRRSRSSPAPIASQNQDGSLLPPIRPISNVDLSELDIPGVEACWNEWPGIAWFAASFNGYRYWGEKYHDVLHRARAKPITELTLTELRTVLFLEYRALVHEGEFREEDGPRAQALLAEIRDRVKRGAID